ncbi:FAD-dependent monooxygenase [Natrinema gelatinilyticum]|uniref:FAD-dependent monooxygenase n=1 Tax=Natrinema gelatinilyticum TaxID=2961571 RepID=UPI0020C56B94|nr:FAD-dependent monooxygenase [Natrinema gelatinilyticum]
MNQETDGNSRELSADLVIVGAGPAGCVLGYLLARSGVETVLLEREADLEREFRGYFFQPLVPKLFDEMGILHDLLASVDHETAREIYVSAFGRRYRGFNFTVLNQSYDYALFIEQPPLLRFLIDRAEEYDNFQYYDSTSVTDIITTDDPRVDDEISGDVATGAMVGVEARHRPTSEEWIIHSRLVVGADGRYSTVREAAGIDPGLDDVDVDILWFKLPADAVEAETLARFERDGFLGFIPLGDQVQVAWFIEAGGYPELRERGIGAFREQVRAVDPTLEGVLENHLTDWNDCTLLHPAPGESEEWVRDGLMLIGDAAHVANPFGGQGNSLAIQDAVVAHPVIVQALMDQDKTRRESTTNRPLSRGQLESYENVRRPAVRTVMDAQAAQTRGVEFMVGSQKWLPGPVYEYLLRGALGLADKFPMLGRRRTRLYAYGPEPISVETSLFVENT